MRMHHRFSAVVLALTLAANAAPSVLAAAPAADAPSTTNYPAIQIIPQTNVDVRNDFQVGPTRFDLALDPGEEKDLELQITSRMGRQATFTMLTEDFSAGENENDQTKLYGANRGPYSAKDWVTTAVNSITLNHADRAYIPVTIHVPKDADPGDHYAAVMTQRDLTPEEKKAGGVNVISRVGVLILITVKGPVVTKGDITSISTQQHLYFDLKVPLSIRGKNDGTVRMIPQGTVDIRNILGVTVDQIPVQDWIVLRNSVRSHAFTWTPKFALGFYTAKTNLTIFGNPVAPMSVSFWVIPLLPVLLVLIAIFVVSFLVQVFFSRFEIKRK